jgi:hypothetical protein
VSFALLALSFVILYEVGGLKCEVKVQRFQVLGHCVRFEV